MESLVEIILVLAGVYLALGGIFAATFQIWGLARLDTASHGTGPGFRVLITPGVIALWPLLAWKWRRHSKGRSLLGESAKPISPRRLRAWHRLAWQALAVLVPLMLAAALAWRPHGVSVSQLPWASPGTSDRAPHYP